MNESELSANMTFTYFINARWLVFRTTNGIMALSAIASCFCVALKG